MTSRTYTIANATSGLVLGTYAADTPEAALDALARDAGYRDATHATAEAGYTDLLVEEHGRTYIITLGNGDVQHVTPTTDESADAYVRGIRALDALKIAPDTYVYRAEETGEWYEVTGHDIIALGLGCDYSHWCTHHGVLAERQDY